MARALARQVRAQVGRVRHPGQVRPLEDVLVVGAGGEEEGLGLLVDVGWLSLVSIGVLAGPEGWALYEVERI